MVDLKIPIKFTVPYGHENKSTIYVKDTSGNFQQVDSVKYFKVEKLLNGLWNFEVDLLAISDTEKAYIKERAEVLFMLENNIFLKGRIQKVEYATAWECNIKGGAIGSLKLLDREFTKSGTKKIGYTNISAQTIAKELLSTNSDGASPWILQNASTGIFTTDYGLLSMRYENANRLKALAKLAEAIDYDWWESWTGNNYETERFHMATAKGSDNSITFTTSGASQNAYLTKKEKDTENLVNDLDMLGYGDGDAQIKTNCYVASTTDSILASSDTKLNGAITSTATTITVDSTTGFPSSGTIRINDEQITYTGKTATTFTTCTRAANSSTATPHDDNDDVLQYSQLDLADATDFASTGTIRIMEEQISYTGKSTNTLTGITRGANSTTPRAHLIGCYVEKHLTKANAESDTSMEEYGILDYTIIDKSIKDLPTLELSASKVLIDRKDAIERYTVQVNDPYDAYGDVNLGDTITITDAESDIDSTYRIVGMNLISEWGEDALELECSNRSIRLIEQLQKEKEERENMAKYSQGFSNIYQVHHIENCATNYGLKLRFYIPSDAISVENVKLNYKVDDYRIFHSTTTSSSNMESVVHTTHAVASPQVTTSWTSGAAVAIGNNVGDMTLCYFTAVITTDASDCPLGSTWNILVSDGTNDYPDSGGYYHVSPDTVTTSTSITGSHSHPVPSDIPGYQYIYSDSTPDWDTYQAANIYTGPQSLDHSHSHKMQHTIYGVIIVPGDTANKTLTLKLIHYQGGQTYDVDTIMECTVYSLAHTHDATYAITETANACSDIVIEVNGNDVTTALENHYGTLDTSGEEEIDLKTYSGQTFTAGAWNTIEIKPTGNCRIEGTGHIQVFVEGKT